MFKFFMCLPLFFISLYVVLSDSSVDDSFPSQKCETTLPECHCEEGYMDVAVLMCRNVTNFEHFSRTLSDGSVFEINTTLDINLSGVRVLPLMFLEGLILERLYIDEIQTILVEDGAFNGMLQLQKFYVQLSSIKEIPDFGPISNSLRNLNLDNSQLTSISGDRLKNLNKLESISFVNNSILSVASDAFEGTNNLIIFDLSYNQLKSLPQNLFNSWKKLNKVVLTSNQLLHLDQLFAVANPSFIFLDHNNLTDLDSIFYPNMTKAQTVFLSYNPLSKITENSFNNKVDNVHSLFMDNCLISEFDVAHFKKLSFLSALDLSYNRIENVINATIQFGVGLDLSLTGNKIKEFNVNLAYRVAHFNLNNNQLTSVSRSLQNSQVLDAYLAENLIETLGPEDFHGAYGIQNIELQGNLISKIDPLTFQGIRRDLVYLDLSRNRIRSLQGCVRDLYLLTSLNLTGNMIETLEEGEFIGMVELLKLYLDGNFITTLGNEIHHLDQLQMLFITNNRISTLKPEQMPQKLEYIYFEGNPFKCDCQLLPFLQYLNSSSIKADEPLCIPPNQTSLLPPAKCPVGCNCFCTQSKNQHFMSVDCSSTGLTELPSLFTTDQSTKENCSSMNIYFPRQTRFSLNGPFVIEDEIGSLNLSHNSLKSLENAELPVGMRHLFIDRNHLQTPPLSLLYSVENLSKVSLSGNPWFCNCDSLAFKEWLLYKSEIVLDGNKTCCGTDSPGLTGRVIWSLTDLDLCPVRIGSSASLVIGILCFILVIAAITIVLMVYWTKVKIWLFAHGITCFQQYDTVEMKEFENLHLLQTGQRNLQSNNFPLPNDQREIVGIAAEFHPSGDNLFQGRFVEQPKDGYVNLS